MCIRVKLRLIAAAVLIPVLLAVLFIAPTIVMAILLGLVCAIGAYELLVGTGFVKHTRLMIYTMIGAFLVPIWCYTGMVHTAALCGIFAFACLLFGEILISKGKLRFSTISVCFAGGFVIPYLLSALMRIMGDGSGRSMIAIPFVIAFMSDSGAYFVGSIWGRHKLAPNISPNKSIEGFVGGILSAVLGMLIFTLVIDIALEGNVNYLFAITYGILGAFAGTFGDLCFSAIKRQAGIKDYGNLIPGHGGVLDRFDSLAIVAPLTEVLLAFLPILE